MKTLLSEQQRDALQELMNISMGRAANALARLIGAKVTLSIPRIVAVTPQHFAQMLKDKDVWYTRQSFLGHIGGEVLTVLSKTGCDSIGELMDYEVPLDNETLSELLLELANILAGACLSGFAEQLGLNAKLSMPTLFFPQNQQVVQVHWASTLMMEVEFKVEASQFDSRVVICLDEIAVGILLQALNRLLE
ncbi:chemotaxis protein CheC [Arsukibacterium tuosuense]|uniref:Chemotaxis protein CheC n=1 Tax=Arsukibacterium tuosuense TaxID=1323745 RepID=A0A285JJ62_9GAMM|nr:chemotaxis protein CheC [Arsukibacterium tuosuense]SNY60339.1 chemotaxis protein CheC [Arsukibacterium tuosuense]